MRRPRSTDWNVEPADADGIAVPYDEKDTEGHGILPDPTKTREFATKASDEADRTDASGPVQGDERS